jgi:hypothetical protein
LDWPRLAAVPLQAKRRCSIRGIVVVPGNKDSEASVLPSKEVITEMGKSNEDLVKSGGTAHGRGASPDLERRARKFSEEKRTITDGPFTESRGVIAGFWLWQVKSMEEAIEWLKRAPFGGRVEIEPR